MGERRKEQSRRRIPMPGGFVFFPEELRSMHQTLCVGIRCSTEREYGSFGRVERGFVARQVWRILRAVQRRCPSGALPPSVLQAVYCSALIAYRTARMQGKTPHEARRSAVVFALIPLSKHIDEPRRFGGSSNS